MFKFFRKIRQNLLNEGKTARYFKYAIGEIILVVIGILIALQINNKNEDWKDRKKEKVILNTILTDLKANKKLIKQGLIEYKEHDRVTKAVASLIGKEANNNNIQSLDKVLFYSGDYVTIVLVDSTISSLATSNKLDLIQNESLKQQISKYPSSVNLYKEREELVRSIVINLIRRTLEKYFPMQRWYDGIEVTFDTDYSGLFSDRQLSNNYINRLYQNQEAVDRLDLLDEINNGLIDTITTELDYD